jgi:hypothetical protein
MDNGAKLNFLAPFDGVGVIGQSYYNVGTKNKLRIVIQEVEPTNVVLVKGRINLQTTYDTVDTLTGSGTFTTDVSTYDYIRFECVSYSSQGRAVLISSSYVDITGALVDDSGTDGLTTWSSKKIIEMMTSLGDKYVRSTRFATISEGTSGTLSISPQQTIILDDFGGTVDAIVTTISGGRPTVYSAQNSDEQPIAATLDVYGNWTFIGTPSSYPVAIIYRVREKFSSYLDFDENILGFTNYQELRPEGETITLTLQDITNKSVKLTNIPLSPNAVSLSIEEGIPQINGIDFVVIGDVLMWNGLGLDNFLEVGETLIIHY